MPTLDQGWAALLGALVGGLATMGGAVITGWWMSNGARRQEKRLLAATALLIQDDFLHYQATLAHALDTSSWWDPTRLLPAQSTVEGRKLVWAGLATKKTNLVAGAQGWMDVLIQQRHAVGAAAPLAAHEVGRLRDVFCRLERGRKALQKLAQRDYTPFEDSGVFDDLTRCRTLRDLIGEDSCF